MTWLYTVSYLILSLLAVQKCNGISSPIQTYTNYKYSTELQVNVADLWWTVNETQQDIIFELHIKTTGWIALGISPGISLKRKIILHSPSPSHPLICSWWNERC
jgi:hypothetical protein